MVKNRREFDKQFLVQYEYDDGVVTALKFPHEIINGIDMSDCNGINSYNIYDVSKMGKVKKLIVYGPWHCKENVLYIKVCLPNGDIVFDGECTDH